MLKKLIFILAFCSLIFAQAPAKKWVIIQDLQDRIVYLDTSAIKEYENQISVWGLTNYRKPQRVSPFNDEVAQIKSNLLFNKVTNMYSVVGTLYYDKGGRIIGESAAPRITGGENSFELPIQPGSSIESLFQKSIVYVTTGTLQADESEFSPNSDGAKDNPKKANDAVADSTAKPSGPIILSHEENIAFIDEANVKTFAKRDSIAQAKKQENPSETAGKKLLEPNSVLKPPTNKSDLSDLKLDTKKSATKKTSYNVEDDTNVRGNIWSDGIRYTIQLSSWREKNVAEKLVSQKKAEGHDAFLMQVELPRRGTWFRVRVGYFNTLEEAQNYRRQNNL